MAATSGVGRGGGRAGGPRGNFPIGAGLAAGRQGAWRRRVGVAWAWLRRHGGVARGGRAGGAGGGLGFKGASLPTMLRGDVDKWIQDGVESHDR